jgi:hypothetical protein
MAKAKVAKKAPARKGASKTMKPRRPQKPGSDGVVRLSGGNPQVAKGYGDAPVQAYIKAMPGWQKDVGQRLDAVITRVLPRVEKAVKWNSPFYGVERDSWFASFHVFAKYVKVTFFRGASLHPQPAGKSKYVAIRYLDIREGEFDEKQFADWVKQASILPGEKM